MCNVYVAFVDFKNAKKAFDNVDRRKLYIFLVNWGIKGKMFSAIKSIYSFVTRSYFTIKFLV